MASISSFFDMGGYAGFVWSSFGLSAVLLIGIYVISMRSLKANRLALEAMTADRDSSASNQPEGSTSSETQA